MTDHDPHHLAQLETMREYEQFIADRVGAPGCNARRRAADNVESLTWAINRLSPPVELVPAQEPVLTMAEARRRAGFGNLGPVPRDPRRTTRRP